MTALWWAALKGHVNIVQMMVNHGAAVDLGRSEVTNHDYLFNLWVEFLGVVSSLSMLVLI